MWWWPLDDQSRATGHWLLTNSRNSFDSAQLACLNIVADSVDALQLVSTHSPSGGLDAGLFLSAEASGRELIIGQEQRTCEFYA